MQGKIAKKAFNHGMAIMKTCRGKGMMISRLLDGDLSHDEAAQITAHLGVCTLCKKLLDAYKMQKELVGASFSDKPLPLEIVASLFSGDRRSNWLRMPYFSRFISAAAIVVLCAVASGIYLMKNVRASPAAPLAVILESTHPATMCVPFSSLIYYEEYAGAAVHSQFVKMSPQRALYSSTEAQQLAAASYYESPLFRDNATESVNTTQEEK
jgi:hypothetical protein